MEEKCIRLGSVTYASKAKERLSDGGIRSRFRKISNERDGCSYLLEVDGASIERAAEILKKNEIKFTITDRCGYL